MPVTELRLAPRLPLAEAVYQNLRDAILAGELGPDERLAEQALASLANVSRTPVREALHKLEADGLLERGRGGLVVSTVTTTDLAEMCGVRETLEGMAAAAAAQYRSEFELLTLRNLHRQLVAAVRDRHIPTLVRLNGAFHEAIWEAARNSYLFRQLFILRAHIERMQSTTLAAPARQRETLKEHQAILDSIEQQSAEHAELAGREHFRHAMAARLAHHIAGRTGS